MATHCPKCQTNNPETAKFCSECGTQLPSIEDIAVTETIESPKGELTRGTTFAGRYEIIEELGKGGMGRVYRVEDTKAKEEIALKLIKPEIALDKKTIDRFRNELTTARKITHKNVCRMYDLGEEKGLHFITMEYISGQDLIYLVLYVAAIFSIIANIFLLAYSGNELGPLDLNSLIFVFSLIAVLIFGGVLIYRCLFRKSRFKFIDNYFVRLAFLFFCGFSFLVCVDPLNIFYLNKDWWEIQLWITLIIFIIGAVIIYKHLGDFYYCVQQNVGPVGNILCRGEFFGRMADPVNLTPS